MRLNLPKYHCVQFGIFSEFTVSMEQDADIQSFVSQTATHSHSRFKGDDERTLVALFGSKSRVSGVIHQVQCTLSRQLREDEPTYSLSITNHRVSENLPAPPRDYRPVSVVIESASWLFGSVDVNCDAVFEYDQSHGFRSRINYPIPMIVQENEGGITHVEHAQFSRRYNDEIEYRILVVNSEDSDSFVHSVRFQTTTDLDRTGVRRLFDRARSISSQLSIRTEDI